MGRFLGIVGFALFVIAALTLLVANRRLTSMKYGGVVVVLVGLLGIFSITCSYLPRVEGTVHGLRSNKGGFDMYVYDQSGMHTIIGDSDARCRDGSHLVKPGWTTHYHCDGLHGSPSDIFIYGCALLELAAGISIVVSHVRKANAAQRLKTQ